MIWPKEISFDGFGEKASEWCKWHGFIKKHFEYLTTMPESTEQINSIKLDLILWEYSPEYRKWIKGGKK